MHNGKRIQEIPIQLDQVPLHVCLEILAEGPCDNEPYFSLVLAMAERARAMDAELNSLRQELAFLTGDSSN